MTERRQTSTEHDPAEFNAFIDAVKDSSLRDIAEEGNRSTRHTSAASDQTWQTVQEEKEAGS